MGHYIEAIVFSAILLGTPGPAVIALLYSGINYGFFKTMPFFTGVIVGFFLNLLCGAFFIFYAFKISTIVVIFFQIISLIYIGYLSYKIATSSVISESSKNRVLKFRHGFLLNLINPKAYVAVFSSYTQFINKDKLFESLVILFFINVLSAVLLQGAWVAIGDKIKFLFKNYFWNRTINIFLALSIWIAIISVYIKNYL